MTSEVRADGRRRVGMRCEGGSKTERAHGNEVNINQIVARYHRTGMLPTRLGSPMYGDFTAVSDYHGAVEAVKQADEEFMKLPAAVRKRFGNDAGRLLEFLEDPANRPEAERLGLVEPAKASVEAPVEPVVEAGEPAAAGGVAQ